MPAGIEGIAVGVAEVDGGSGRAVGSEAGVYAPMGWTRDTPSGGSRRGLRRRRVGRLGMGTVPLLDGFLRHPQVIEECDALPGKGRLFGPRAACPP